MAYVKLISDHRQKIHQIELDGARKRASIWSDASKEVSQMITEGWKANQKTADQRAVAFSRMIRGVDAYADSQGKTQELTSGYSRAWKLDDGSYVLSTQANFDPWRDLGLRGQPLEQQR